MDTSSVAWKRFDVVTANPHSSPGWLEYLASVKPGITRWR
jgi:hypothetical protein